MPARLWTTPEQFNLLMRYQEKFRSLRGSSYKPLWAEVSKEWFTEYPEEVTLWGPDWRKTRAPDGISEITNFKQLSKPDETALSNTIKARKRVSCAFWSQMSHY